jgi:RNA polymerase subunit RPABC4/transcription elongation factor Spt4
MPDLGAFMPLIQLLVAFFGAYFLAMWISLIIWTFRDVRARARDLFLQILSVALVVVFNLPGLVLYFLLRPRETLADAYERELAEEAMLQDIEEKQACPNCHQKIQLDFLLCPNCRTTLKRQCEHCHRLLSLRWNVCPFCGTAVRAATPPASPTPTPIPAPARASVPE